MAKLTDALDAPFVRLIEGDSGAVKALNDLRTRQFVASDATEALRQDAPLAATDDTVTIARRGDVDAVVERRPPYDFSWSWHTGHAPFAQMLIPSPARVGLDARSGALAGGASGFVNAHAGYGVLLTTPQTVTATGWSVLEPGQWSYVMRSVGLGSNATSEGGVEVTALEDGRLVASAGYRLWRRRIGAGESASDRGGPYVVGIPDETTKVLTFTMHPGREYTFNVGIWVFGDRSTGIGTAAVQSLFQGNVTKSGSVVSARGHVHVASLTNRHQRPLCGGQRTSSAHHELSASDSERTSSTRRGLSWTFALLLLV